MVGWLGRIGRWPAPGTLISVASVVYALPLALIPFVTGLWHVAISGLTCGAAQGANTPSIQTAIAGWASFEYRAAFTPTNATIIRAGQTVGPVLIGLSRI